MLPGMRAARVVCAALCGVPFVIVLSFLSAACSDDGGSGNGAGGGPIAGMAEGYADFPVGTPLGGISIGVA